jgi:hypothetical protein
MDPILATPALLTSTAQHLLHAVLDGLRRRG